MQDRACSLFESYCVQGLMNRRIHNQYAAVAKAVEVYVYKLYFMKPGVANGLRKRLIASPRFCASCEHDR